MALDVTQCSSEREKLQWAFRLYDVDASGSITVHEMENIIQTLDRVSTGALIPVSGGLGQRLISIEHIVNLKLIWHLG
jgi:Ca2+-binding EF-hand superfamily protein